MEINLTDEEVELLREILDQANRDLRYEIADTDRSSYRQVLRARESLLQQLLAHVGAPPP